MATLEGLAEVVKAASESGNPITKIETQPDGSVEITFLQGLELAYAQEAVVGAGNPDAKTLERAINSGGEVEIEADASYKTKDTLDIHLEHREKLAGEVEVEGTPQNLADFVEQIEAAAATVEQRPVPESVTGLDTTDLQMLNSSNITQEFPQETIATQQFITKDAVVTFTNENPPIVRVEFDEKTVSLPKLEEQLQGLAQNGALGENGSALVGEALQEIRNQFPQLVIAEAPTVIMTPPSAEPVANLSADERGVRERQIPINATAQASAQITRPEYQGVAATQMAQTHAI